MVIAIVAGQLWLQRGVPADLLLTPAAAAAPASTTTVADGSELLTGLGGGAARHGRDSTDDDVHRAPANGGAAGLALPVPERLPADPYAETPEVVLGRITIPAIGLDQPLQQGMTLTAINRGPSHWPGTAAPGGLGNAVIAGHRTTYTEPFRDLDRLQPGDQVIYTTTAGTFTYEVTGTEIVTPEEVRIADQTAGYTSTLFACHPPGSAAYRIVTHLQLLDDAGLPVAAPDVALTPVTIPRL